MNVLFITIENYSSFDQRSIYMDLINELISRGHYVSVISACERRDKENCQIEFYQLPGKGDIRKIHIPNITKVGNFVLKGINLLISIPLFKKAAKKAAKNLQYDLVLYGSPPISILGAIQYIKKKQNARTYLMLKDIWPYDCLFGGALETTGWKRHAFNLLALLARRLYQVSDTIGCMSPANIRFLVENEPDIDRTKLEICPNCIRPLDCQLSEKEKKDIRGRYGIPEDKVVFVYGGNLGIPQGIDYVIQSIIDSRVVLDAFFLVIGGGTEADKLQKLSGHIQNFQLVNTLPKDDYDSLVSACDVGLVYLNCDCLAPNFPSRILTYMQASLPLLCATDVYTDVGTIAETNGFGFSCESRETAEFVNLVNKLCDSSLRAQMGLRAYRYLHEHYSASKVCDIITTEN